MNKKAEYLKMLCAVVGVIPVDNPSQHHKDVVKQILRLYSHGAKIKETPKATAELERRAKNPGKKRKDDNQWVPLSIHHQHKISDLAGNVTKRVMAPKKAMTKSILRTKMTQQEHDDHHKGKPGTLPKYMY